MKEKFESFTDNEKAKTLLFYFICIICAYSVFLNPIMTSDYIPSYASQGVQNFDWLSLLSSGRFATILIMFIYTESSRIAGLDIVDKRIQCKTLHQPLELLRS